MLREELVVAGPRILRDVRVILFFGLITAAQAVTAAEGVTPSSRYLLVGSHWWRRSLKKRWRVTAPWISCAHSPIRASSSSSQVSPMKNPADGFALEVFVISPDQLA